MKDKKVLNPIYTIYYIQYKYLLHSIVYGIRKMSTHLVQTLFKRKKIHLFIGVGCDSCHNTHGNQS